MNLCFRITIQTLEVFSSNSLILFCLDKSYDACSVPKDTNMFTSCYTYGLFSATD